MSHRYLTLIGGLAAVLLVQAPAGAQVSAATAKNFTPPRTPDGQPDLQGLWTNATITSFERPSEFAGKEFLTKEEAAAYEKRTAQTSNRDQRGATPEADVGGAYNDFWFDRGSKVVPTLRTSFVIDPPDGKVPAMTPEAKKAAAARAAIASRLPEGPEDMGLPERCIIWPNAGPPMVPTGYNNNYRILQSRNYVAILIEMIHDVRIIPLDGSPHAPANIRQWMGDSRGHWEGNTLVVDTTNFTNKTHFRGADENLHLIERFTRADPNTILYQFTVDDPTAFTKQWTAEIPLVKTPGPIYEYACHEGNYSVPNVLRGARVQEKAAEEAAKKGSK